MMTVRTVHSRVPSSQLPALVIAVVVALVGPLFVASYSLAMGDPAPHGVPVGVVGTAGDADAVGRALDARDSGVFVVSAYDDGGAARTALSRQEIYAVVQPDADPPTVLISSASGESVARLVADRTDALTAALGAEPRLVDVHPLAPRDPYGLVMFYLALGATILGFVGAIQTRVNAGRLSLRGELGWDVGRSAVVALAMTLVVGPVLGLERLPVVPVWLILATTMFVAAMVYSFWRVAIGGRWALLPTWITFVVVANPSSGGAVAPELLPAFYEVMGRWLPTGATVRAIRDVTYFPGAVHVEPFVVLGVWLLISTAAFVAVRLRRFGPRQMPAAPAPTFHGAAHPPDDVHARGERT